MSNFLSHGVTMPEIKYLYENLEEWSKPRKVKTPIGKRLMIFRSRTRLFLGRMPTSRACTCTFGMEFPRFHSVTPNSNCYCNRELSNIEA